MTQNNTDEILDSMETYTAKAADESHDPSGRECALAGRVISGAVESDPSACKACLHSVHGGAAGSFRSEGCLLCPDEEMEVEVWTEAMMICESGWTGDRCTFALGHEGLHSNETHPYDEQPSDPSWNDEQNLKDAIALLEKIQYPELRTVLVGTILDLRTVAEKVSEGEI